MRVQIKLVIQPGDTAVNRAEVVTIDSQGMEGSQKIILEGEQINTEVDVGTGGRIEIRAIDVPVVYDRDQHATVPLDLTPEDPLTNPNKPTVTPQKGLGGVPVGTPYDDGKVKPGTQGEQPFQPGHKTDYAPPPATPSTTIGKDKTPESGKIDTKDHVLSSSKEEPKPHVPSKK